MRLGTKYLLKISLCLAFISSTHGAHAGLFRAYLAANGSDINPCTVSAPCRLLPAALNAVNDAGEIWILDSANYNTATVTIAKSVTILAIPGAVGSFVSTGSGAALTINAATPAKVLLRNLVIVPYGTPGSGVEFVGGSNLTVDHCTFTGPLAYAVHINGPTSATVQIQDTHVTGAGTGIQIDGPGSELIRMTVLRSTIDDVLNGIQSYAGLEFTMESSQVIGRGLAANGSGIRHQSDLGHTPVHAHIARSVVSEFLVGVASYVAATSTSVILSISDSEVSQNGYGVYADQAGAFAGNSVALTGNRLVHNSFYAVHPISPTFVYTSGSNYFAFNGTDGGSLVLGPSAGGLK